MVPCNNTYEHLSLLGLQSRGGDKPLKLLSSLSPERDCRPKKVDSPFTARTDNLQIDHLDPNLPL